MRLVKRLLCAALLLYVSTCVVARVSTAGVSVKKGIPNEMIIFMFCLFVVYWIEMTLLLLL